jgi:hypothetical protein
VVMAPPPPGVKVFKVFEGETLSLDFDWFMSRVK